MKYIVDLYVGGKVFKEEVQANNQQDARYTAQAKKSYCKSNRSECKFQVIKVRIVQSVLIV
jgi:hypothetical protein